MKKVEKCSESELAKKTSLNESNLKEIVENERRNNWKKKNMQ